MKWSGTRGCVAVCKHEVDRETGNGGGKLLLLVLSTKNQLGITVKNANKENV